MVFGRQLRLAVHICCRIIKYEFILLFNIHIDITYGDLVEAQPFGNTLDTTELRGDHLREVLEYSATIDSVDSANMLMFSGTRLAVVEKDLYTFLIAHFFLRFKGDF